VWYMYRSEQNKLEETFAQIDGIFTPSIVSSLWITDYETLQKNIQGLTEFHYIDRIEILDDEGNLLNAGTEDTQSLERIKRDLVYSYKGETRNIGSMYIYVNRKHMQGEILLSAFLSILIGLFLSLVLSSVMAWVFYTVIGRHLSRFASFLQKDNPAENDSSFSLDSKTSRKDELALVVDHFNDMRQKMRRSILEIQEWHDLMDYIIRHDPNAIAVYDRDMRYIFVSWKYIEDHRLNGLEVIGRTCYEVFPDLKDKWEDIHQSVLAGEDLSQEDDLIVHRDGTTDDVSWQYHPLKDKDGHINGLIYYGVIATERKRMERALFIEKEQFRTTLFSVGDGIISTDKYSKVVLMNRVAEELTGWIFDEAIGNPLEMVFNLVNENTLDSCGNPVEKVLETGKIVELANKTMLISRTGNAIPIEDSAAPILDQEGNITGANFQRAMREMRSGLFRLLPSPWLGLGDL